MVGRWRRLRVAFQQIGRYTKQWNNQKGRSGTLPEQAVNQPQGTLVLKKAAAILNAFSFEDRYPTLSRLAQVTGLPKSTVHRILQTLQQLGWVVTRPDQTYALGPGLIELGGIARSSLHWRDILAPHLNSLSASVRHAILVATLVDDRLLYVDKRDSHYPLRITTHFGQRRPPHFGAVGKTLLAYLPPLEVDRLLDKYPLERLASQSIVDREELLERLAEIRRKGYALEFSEVLDGVTGVAAPLFGGGPIPVAALGVAVPESLLGPEGLEPLIIQVVNTARQVSQELGARTWPAAFQG